MGTSFSRSKSPRKNEGLSERENITLFNQYQSRILELESEPQVQKDLRSALEGNNAHAPIESRCQRLPPELLIQIFKEVTCHGSIFIHPILLVCKQWYAIAYSCSELWTTITIQPLANVQSINAHIRYVDIAVERSGNLPVDVKIHLPNKLDLWYKMAQQLIGPAPWHEIVSITTTLHNGFITSQDTPTRFYKDVDKSLMKLMYSVVGEKGQTLSRLRSLELAFHSNSFAAWRWANIFAFPAPLLEDLTVLNEEDGYTQDFSRSFLCSKPPRLSRIISNVDLNVKTMLAEEHQLTHLRFLFDSVRMEDLFVNTNITRQLKFLHILFPMNWMTVHEGDFVFPVLEDLTVEGIAEHSVEFIKAPKLKILRLLNGISCKSFLLRNPTFESLERVHVWADWNIVNYAISYIRNSTMLVEFAFLDQDGENILKCMNEVIKHSTHLAVKGYIVRREELIRSFDSYEDFEVSLL